MKRGDFTLALGFTVSPANISHVAECPSVDPVGCANAPIPDHLHDVDISTARVSLAGTIGIRRGLALRINLPFDAKRRRRKYTTLDGQPYVPPYDGDLHHHNDTLSGLGDPTLVLEWNRNLGDALSVGLSGGSSAPIGKTTANPDPLAAQSIEHEHMQIGSGTFDPLFALWGGWTRGAWGVYGRLDAKLPVYESSEGYQGGRQLDLVLGPGYRFGDRFLAFMQIGISSSGEEHWDGKPNEVSARDVARIVLGGNIGLSEHLRVGPVVQIELINSTVGGEFKQPIIATVTFTYNRAKSTGKQPL